jgi:hypothetical protein
LSLRTAPCLSNPAEPIPFSDFRVLGAAGRPPIVRQAWERRYCHPAKLDRLFRSALDALKVVESLKTRGVKLHLLDLGGDIAGNGLSKLFLTIAAAFRLACPGRPWALSAM